MNLDLEARYLEIMLNILNEFTPEYEVRIFGSRVRGTSRKYSDVDLLFIGKKQLDTKILNNLKDLFSCSDLPYMVDIIDWQTISDSFREAIGSNSIVIKKGSN